MAAAADSIATPLPMAIPFTKTLTFLESEDRGPSIYIGAGALVLIVAWLIWASVTRTTVYSVSEEGRLLAAGAASPVQTPVAGVVQENLLVLGSEVKAGDVLLRLDTQAETLRKAEEETRVAGLKLDADNASVILEAEQTLAIANAHAGASRVSSAATRAKVAADIAALSREQDETMRRLKEASLVSRLDALKAEEDVGRQSGQVKILVADTAQTSADVDRAGQETNVHLLNLNKELTDMRARIAESQALIASLDWEIARRTLRAAIGGKVADIVALPKGAAISPGQTVATIVPDAPLRWVAYFAARDAVGRIHQGQHARIRLDAFPWTAYGALGATVLSVGSEPREQRIRVEFALDASNPNIPLSHGMTGVTDVEVDQLPPLRLLLRLSGQYVQNAPPTASPETSSSSAPF